MCSKVLSTCRRRRRLIFSAAKGTPNPYQASQPCSPRRPVPEFEPEITFAQRSKRK